MDKKFTILYVDDERGNLNAFKNTFRRDYRILLAETPAEGLALLESEKIDLILSDQRMPEMSGVEFLQRSLAANPDPNRILVTAYSDFEAIQNAINDANIFKFVKKPWDPQQFKGIIDHALEAYDLKQQNKRLTQQLKDKNQELEAANQELVESDRLKYDFLRIISHEMRTPLNGLKGATQLFKISTELKPDPTNESLLAVLESSTGRLEQFLLLAERITTLKAGQYSLNLQQVDISKLVQNATTLLRDELSRNQHRVEFDFDPNAEEITADEEILSICIREVLHNATKHTPPNAGIQVKTESLGDQIAIEVSDEGSGFPDRVLRNIFKVFVRDDTGRDQSLGLNLALTKLVMDLHGGTVEAANNPEGGANVKLVLNQSAVPV